MNHFLKSIQINKLFHLEDIKIEIDNDEKKHLIITGKNGSGKTILLNAIVDFLQTIKVDQKFYFNTEIHSIERKRKELDTLIKGNYTGIIPEEANRRIEKLNKQIDSTLGRITLVFPFINHIAKAAYNNEFLICILLCK